MQTEQVCMRRVTVAVYPSGNHYLSALALDSMRWVTGARTAPSVGKVDPTLEAWATRGMALLTRPDARFTECNLGPVIVVPEGALVLECQGWANV